MSTSVRQFNQGLHTEHLEEASFLYGQRRALMVDAQIPWTALANFEERLEAHLDGLLVGGVEALRLCSAHAAGDDAGEIFAAVSVFCRSRQSGLLAKTLRAMNCDNAAVRMAVIDALKYELPDEWSAFVVQALARRDARLTPMLAAVAGYRRMPIGAALLQALGGGGPVDAATLYGLGRLKLVEAAPLATAALRTADGALRDGAGVALLRMAIREPAVASASSASQHHWTPISLGLGGERTACDILVAALRQGAAQPEFVHGLGLLGNPAALQPLYDLLKVPPLADAAALALHWITGAGLFEGIFENEEVREDELFPDELQAWRQRGEPPMRGDGRRFGRHVVKLSTSKEAWKEWFIRHAHAFDPNVRYRNGKPFTPAALLENLADERSDYRLRRTAADELAIRYGCDVPFEVDMPVAQQLRALRSVADWVEANGSRFRPGLWYFAGHPI